MPWPQGQDRQAQSTNRPVIDGVPDTAEAIQKTFQAAGNQDQLRPQILLIILSNRNNEVSLRVNRNCECLVAVRIRDNVFGLFTDAPNSKRPNLGNE